MKQIENITFAVVIAALIALVLTTPRYEPKSPVVREHPLWCHIPEDTSLSSLCSTNSKQRNA